MKKILSFFLALSMLILPVISLAEGEVLVSDKQKIRTIVTADWLDDDQCSLVRLLVYANEFEIEGIIADKSEPGNYIIAGSAYELGGKTVTNKDIAQFFIDAYAEDYEHLIKHDPSYPTPEYLTSINVDGNVAYNDYASDTEGSEIIKRCILDEREDVLFIQCWGGTATLAAALRSIEDEYKNTDQWDAIRKKVYAKVVVWHDLGQDSCYDEYVIPHWPELTTILSQSQFQAMVIMNSPYIPDELVKYYAGDWVAENITHGNSALSKAYYDIKGTHKNGAAKAAGYADAQHAVAEGDTPNFFYIFDNGLRQLEDPSYGGWGGRFVRANQMVWMMSRNRSKTFFYIDIPDDGDLYKPVYRWTEDFQNDFAARMEWTYKSYEDANHEHVVQVVEGIDLTAAMGDTVTITARTYDPDGDKVNVSFWQYDDADTYGGTVELVAGEGDQVSFVVPADARPGNTIHIIVEAADDVKLPMTRYQRVIVTVVAPPAAE